MLPLIKLLERDGVRRVLRQKPNTAVVFTKDVRLLRDHMWDLGCLLDTPLQKLAVCMHGQRERRAIWMKPGTVRYKGGW